MGNVIYEQGSAAKILFDGGYYSLVDNLCHYFTRDHLGSIRTMVNEMVFWNNPFTIIRLAVSMVMRVIMLICRRICIMVRN